MNRFSAEKEWYVLMSSGNWGYVDADSKKEAIEKTQKQWKKEGKVIHCEKNPRQLETIASELIKVAKELTASDGLLDNVLKDSDLKKLEKYVDAQTWDLVVEVYMKLEKRFRMSNDESEALNRLLLSLRSASGYSAEEHRNNIFKAAHALGIKLPSGIF